MTAEIYRADRLHIPTAWRRSPGARLWHLAIDTAANDAVAVVAAAAAAAELLMMMVMIASPGCGCVAAQFARHCSAIVGFGELRFARNEHRISKLGKGGGAKNTKVV